MGEVRIKLGLVDVGDSVGEYLESAMYAVSLNLQEINIWHTVAWWRHIAT